MPDARDGIKAHISAPRVLEPRALLAVPVFSAKTLTPLRALDAVMVDLPNDRRADLLLTGVVERTLAGGAARPDGSFATALL